MDRTVATPAGLVLAAGEGRRFGGPKALARLDGDRFVERALRILGDGGCRPLTVVLGAGAEAVAAEATLAPAVVVVNPGWATGMGSSLRVGLAAQPAEVPAVVVGLVDQPAVGPEAVARLIAAWRAGAGVAVATYAGRALHPVLLDRRHWADVAASATGDRGARAFLRSRPDLVTPVPCDGTGSAADVDTVEDLDRFRDEGGQPRC